MNADMMLQVKYIFGAIFYSLLGLMILGIAFKIFDKMTPGELWVEIVREKNLPMAIVTGAMILAIAQIIASAIHG